MKLRIYSDGASRGNPGIAAIAFIILDKNGKPLKKHSGYLGVRTNNQAEYEAIISALESASRLTDQELVCHLDSELVVRQLKSEYRVRNPKLRALWLRVQELKQKFRRVAFVHVARTDRYIQEVDSAANQVLNKVGKGRL